MSVRAGTARSNMHHDEHMWSQSGKQTECDWCGHWFPQHLARCPNCTHKNEDRTDVKQAHWAITTIGNAKKSKKKAEY